MEGGPVTLVPSAGDSSDLFLRQMSAVWKMAGRARMRREDEEDKEDERIEERRAEVEEKGTARVLNIEEGESNAATFERS